MSVYLNLPVLLANGVTVTTRIKNYLQNGKGDQSARAQAKQGLLLQRIGDDLKPKGVPPVFTVDSYEFWRLSIERTFMGKGAPTEIEDTLWLASKYDMVEASSIDTFCDRNLGLDCGGFIANYWGIGYPENGRKVSGSTGFAPRDFWTFDRSKRRARTGDIEEGDAIIFFKHMKGDDTDLANVNPALGGEAYHIGMVGGVTVLGDKIDLTIVELSGAQAFTGGNGVNSRQVSGVPLKSAKGLVYVDAGKNWDNQEVRLYFVGKRGNFVSYLPYALD